MMTGDGWIVMQVFNRVGSTSDATGDGVAYIAHIGGFAAGPSGLWCGSQP